MGVLATMAAAERLITIVKIIWAPAERRGVESDDEN